MSVIVETSPRRVALDRKMFRGVIQPQQDFLLVNIVNRHGVVGGKDKDKSCHVDYFAWK